jgi:hypothetical protein
MRKRHAVAVSSFFALAIVMGACSSNSSQVQDKIAEDIKKQTGVDNAKVTCPKDVKASKGETFSCDASGDFTSYLQKQGVNAKLDHIKFNVTFVDDKTFSADIDTVQLQADLQSQNPGGATDASLSDSSFTDSTSS